ncbi:sugar transferase [Devosia sp. Leaf64]|uniref:sugar transferase n=1 Tax=Devosia sp. Leaf64 TaxID=1736229 RepID=UPI000A46A4AA|nr:sugar transferase [Devosia sp. Leaf64]
MKIILTGASGFLGSMLVPRLKQRGIQLLLVGRDMEKLREQYPGHACTSYENLAELAHGSDLLVNLAVRNSDAEGTLKQFSTVNVDFVVWLAELAVAAGVKRFVNISSLHALDLNRTQPYAVSKRASINALSAVPEIDVLTVYLAAVHGDRWGGRWSFLNSWNGSFRRRAETVLSAFRPVVHVDRIADYLVAIAKRRPNDLSVILTDGQDGNLFYHGVRRLMDIAAALTILLAFWWLLALIWLGVRLQSSGPGLFVQTRVGRHGAPFRCYKFRTMQVGTRELATHEISGSAVTSLGRFLRRSKLDELPQVLNLLAGEVTLVGPRPCLPVQAELLELRRKFGILELVPGITGLSQIDGIDMSQPARLASRDYDYKLRQCLFLDLRIIISTVLGSGRGDRVGT